MDEYFDDTSWSTIVAAKSAEDEAARAALEKLCRRYWKPLYTYVRRKGHSREDAEDLTQEFLARLLAHDFLANVDRSCGKFRAFLLACLNNFLHNEWDHSRAVKRGCGAPVLPLDFDQAELHCGLLSAVAFDPALAFDAQWAETLMASAERRLAAEYRRAGKSALFEALSTHAGSPGVPGAYGEVALRLDMQEGAVRVSVHRMRRRFAALVREEIGATVGSEAEIQEELDYLIRVLGARPGRAETAHSPGGFTGL